MSIFGSDKRLKAGCFVYAYLREADMSPYYVGYSSRYERLLEKHNVKIPNDGKRIAILRHGLTRQAALKWEAFYIFWYGRIDLGSGILRNQNHGGSGGDMGPEVCTKISRAKRGVSTPAVKAAAKRRGSLRGPMSEQEKKNLAARMAITATCPEVIAKGRATKLQKFYDDFKPPFSFEEWSSKSKNERTTLKQQIKSARYLGISLRDYQAMSRGERISATRRKKVEEGLLIPTGSTGGFVLAG